MLRCLVKSMMADHPQQWDDHNGDIRHFISSFKHYTRETLRLCSRYLKVMIYIYIYIYISWCCQNQNICLGRPTDGSGHLEWQANSRVLRVRIRRIMPFTCSIGSAMRSITSTTSGWLMVSCSIATANQVMGDTTSTQGHFVAKFRTLQRSLMRSGQESSGIRIIIDKDSMSYEDEVMFKKVKLHQFLSSHQIWSAETEMFSFSQTASSFMTEHVLYHASVVISNWYPSETILEIMQHPQVRLTERVIKIIRGSHPHMEALLISQGEFRQSITELEIDRSFTVVDMRINPWDIKDSASASASMEVDDSGVKRSKRGSGSQSSSAVLTISAGKLTFN